jgi:hypothetical protein
MCEHVVWSCLVRGFTGLSCGPSLSEPALPRHVQYNSLSNVWQCISLCQTYANMCSMYRRVFCQSVSLTHWRQPYIGESDGFNLTRPLFIFTIYDHVFTLLLIMCFDDFWPWFLTIVDRWFWWLFDHVFWRLLTVVFDDCWPCFDNVSVCLLTIVDYHVWWCSTIIFDDVWLCFLTMCDPCCLMMFDHVWLTMFDSFSWCLTTLRYLTTCFDDVRTLVWQLLTIVWRCWTSLFDDVWTLCLKCVCSGFYGPLLWALSLWSSPSQTYTIKCISLYQTYANMCSMYRRVCWQWVSLTHWRQPKICESDGFNFTRPYFWRFTTMFLHHCWFYV